MTTAALTPGVIYARYSPRREDADCLAKQMETCTQWCEEHGVAVLLYGFDRKTSGTVSLWNRPGLSGCIRSLRPGMLLVVRDLKRIARKTTVALAIEDEVYEQRKCQLASVEDGGILANDRNARLFRIIRYAMADFERAEISERCARVVPQQIHGKRRRICGQIPWGSRLTEAGGKLMEDDPREIAILELVVLLHQRGMGRRRIAQELHRRGIVARNSQPFTADRVRTVLRTADQRKRYGTS